MHLNKIGNDDYYYDIVVSDHNEIIFIDFEEIP
jgi:hypothetical protein